MINNKTALRDVGDVFRDNSEKLRHDMQSIMEERRLLLQSYFSSLMMPDMTFDRAVRQLLGAYRKLSVGRETQAEEDLIWEQVILCQTLAEQFPDLLTTSRGQPFSVFSSKIRQPARLSFWKTNRFSSGGYARFSVLFDTVEPIIAESFSEVCEQVAGQISDFGILPVENTTDGRLSVFYKMLDKHELKVCAVCDVEDPESDTTTRLALVAKTVYLFEGDFPRFIEFSYISTDVAKREGLLCATRLLASSLTRLSSLPLSYRTNASVETVTLALPTKSTLPFLIYLQLFFKDINILGFFVQI